MADVLKVTVAPGNTDRIEALIESPVGDCRIVTESNYTLDQTPTPWLPPTMATAMRFGWDLELNGPVDATAVAGAEQAQNVIAGWYPRRYSKIAISGSPDSSADPQPGGVGCFFSGGVDSFYSAITQLDRVTHLVFVHGFDIHIDDEDLAERALTAVREAASELGKPLIEVRTTIRSALGEPLGIPWDYLYHGPSLAHVGLALSPHLRTVIIPSSKTREQLEPWGSHPDLDPLWSSRIVDFEHHELEADRFAKIKRISTSETAMKYLRVCWENRDSAYNCGRCYKCLRTQVGLMVAGGTSAMLPSSIDPNAVRNLVITRELERRRLREWLQALREAGMHDPGLEKAIGVAVRRSYFWQALVRGRAAVDGLLARRRP